MKKILLSMLFIFGFFPYLSAYSASCDAIYQAIDKVHTASIKTSFGLNLAQLKQILGQPDVTKLLSSETFRRWKGYYLLQSINDFGAARGTHGFGEARGTHYDDSSKMGPLLTEATDTVTQYQWSCPNKSMIQVTAVSTGYVQHAEATNCSSGQCVSYAFKFNVMTQTQALYNQAEKLYGPEIDKREFEEKVKNYNRAFNVQIADDNQLQEDVKKRRELFMTNLKNCQAGEYGFPIFFRGTGMLGVEVRKFAIRPEGDTCIVTSLNDQNDPNAKPLVCKFPKDQLSNIATYLQGNGQTFSRNEVDYGKLYCNQSI